MGPLGVCAVKRRRFSSGCKLHPEIHLRANPGAVRTEVVRQLESAISAVRGGALCQCGAQIWIIGSAQTGLGCYRCITGQFEPDILTHLGLSVQQPPRAPARRMELFQAA